jgi:AcrR family transcriptional regulator
MKRPRNPDQTRRAILDAARREFTALGFAGGRTDAIATGAGVNKRMLYHYFGSKEGLYAAVLADRLGAHATKPLAGSLASQVGQRVAEARREPDDLRLLMWEALTDAAPDVVEHATRRERWRARVATLEAAQRDGRLAVDIDPAHLELALTALTVFPVAFRQLTNLITGGTPGEAAFDAAHREFLAAWIGHLAPDADGPPTTIAAATPISTAPSKASGPDLERPAARGSKPRVRLTAATIRRDD